MELPVPEPFLRDGHRDGADNADEQDEEDAAHVHQAELIHRGPGIFVLKWKVLYNAFSDQISIPIQISREFKSVTKYSVWRQLV